MLPALITLTLPAPAQVISGQAFMVEDKNIRRFPRTIKEMSLSACTVMMDRPTALRSVATPRNQKALSCGFRARISKRDSRCFHGCLKGFLSGFQLVIVGFESRRFLAAEDTS